MYSSYEDWETATRSALRIFDPFSYRPAHFERMIPVCLGEAMNLCARSPLLWRHTVAGEPELVALRGLDRVTGIPGSASLSRRSLPLLLQAFPLRLREMEPDADIGFEKASPMRERDGGSYVLDPNGELLPGAELKLNALHAFRHDLEATHRLTELVFRHDLVEPVVLPTHIVEAYALPDFLVVRPFPDDRLILMEFPPVYWPTVARFLSAQRMSLYAMARLIEQSKGAA
ncbi:SapC family protein [Neotabrizicola shimadae]|uniref:SapC family protein n=1 Tax=Neotabrizicola shimadae TaxID=2807096 RepID=A0A8G0ZWM7_9RHOB|nr:SapC family protein [Neotabrizicola shimadae]QYZ70050.1 SapC family protein [Neotabrizicola shimadae]